MKKTSMCLFKEIYLKKKGFFLLAFLFAFLAFPMRGLGGDAVSDSLSPIQVIELDSSEIKDSGQTDFSLQKKSSFYSLESEKESAEWKKYASAYYYDKLTDQAQIGFWDQLDDVCEAYLLGCQDAELVKQSSYALPQVVYTDLEYDKAKQVYQMFRYSNPQYYFLGNSIFINDENKIMRLSVFEEFAKGTDRKEATARVKAQIDKMQEEIGQEETDLRKEKMAHDLICEKVEYDSNYNNLAKNKFNQGIYSVFCTDSTVCAGYSQAMQLLMNGAGLSCSMVTSKSHAWNMVFLDGHWYYTDLTWDDQADNWIYTYFNRSRDKMLSMDTGSHKEEEFWIEYLPEFDLDSPVKRAAAPVMKLEGGKVTMSSPGNEIYYSMDVNTPFRLKNAKKYTEPVSITGETKIVAVSSAKDCFESIRQRFSVYQVEFKLDGAGYGSPVLIEEGAVLSRPVLEKRDGHVFTGWHISPEYNNPYSFLSPVKSSMTLYGAWIKQPVSTPIPIPQEQKTYQVTFDSCGGSSVKAQTIGEGKTAVSINPKRKGYTFKGWYTSKKYKKKYDFSQKVTSSFTLYAKWKANSYKVTYDANKGYIGKKSVKFKKATVTFDKKYGKQPTAKRKGYVFLGWYTKKSGGSKVADSHIVKITCNRKYYARWCKIKTKKAAISSVKSKKPGKITVKIKTINTASGYQIRYSLKSSMKSAKTVKTETTNKTISGLKKGKKYYVQVRMYQKESVSGKIAYGAWSGKKKILVKNK